MDAEILVNTLVIACVAFTLLYFWRFTIVLAVVCILVAWLHPAKASEPRFEIAAIIESEADRVTMQDAVRDAAVIFQDQLGITLVVTYVDINTVAEDTNAQSLLNKLVNYRLGSHTHGLADATVLFTRRDVKGYAGIATVTPACSASASAVVVVRNDGYDGQITAHELLHTLGVPHDHMPGYLMSETLARPGSSTISQDSVLTVRAAGLDQCMAVTLPPTVTTAQQAPAQSSAGGGGGCMEWWFLAAIAILMLFANGQRRTKNKAREAAHYWAMKYMNLKHLGKKS